MQTFQVLMVGPTRVGKTSTLASMSESLQTEVNRLQYHTTIPVDLLQIVNQFKGAAEEDTIIVTQLPLKKGTGDKTTYPIDLIPQNSQQKDITVEFVDIPGGWFLPSDVHYGEVQDILKESVASLWCIDCVSMIEGKNDPEHDYHQSRNAPDIIAGLYKNTVGLRNRHRIIFVLMRAETYIHGKGRGVDWLTEQFQEKYQEFIGALKERGIECFVTYVETLGCFKFQYWQKNQVNQELEARYSRFAKKYAPRNCEAPALLAIERSLREAIAFCETTKRENLALFTKKRKGFLGRYWAWLYRTLAGGQQGDPNEYSRVEDIYQLLTDEKLVDPKEFQQEIKANPYLNSHITLRRLVDAEGKMKTLVNNIQTENRARLL